MRLLLDSHLSPVLARELQRSGHDAVALRNWKDGNFLNSSDVAENAPLLLQQLQVPPDCPFLAIYLRLKPNYSGSAIFVEVPIREK